MHSTCAYEAKRVGQVPNKAKSRSEPQQHLFFMHFLRTFRHIGLFTRTHELTWWPLPAGTRFAAGVAV